MTTDPKREACEACYSTGRLYPFAPVGSEAFLLPCPECLQPLEEPRVSPGNIFQIMAECDCRIRHDCLRAGHCLALPDNTEATCPACGWTGEHAMFSEPAALSHSPGCKNAREPPPAIQRAGWWIIPAVILGAILWAASWRWGK